MELMAENHSLGAYLHPPPPSVHVARNRMISEYCYLLACTFHFNHYNYLLLIPPNDEETFMVSSKSSYYA